MNKSNSYSKMWILIFTIIMIISSYSISSFSVDINEEDGVYFVDIFKDGDNVELMNCTTSKENGKIILDPYGSSTRPYDYTDWTIESEDKAYSYSTPYFFMLLPPKISINFFENEFNSEFDYNAIKNKNNIFYPLEEFDESSPLKIVHHFRFNINENINFTNKLNIYWCGKAENDQKITFYYWQPAGPIGKWEKAASGISNLSVIEIQQNFTGDLFIGEDNFIDICIVATPNFGEKCSLFTDYVKIIVYGQGSSDYGTAISSVISPDFLDRWEFLSWEDYEKSGTSIRYHILYENETGDFNLVDDSYLPGNEGGFTSSPVNLDSLPSYDLKILANLSTNDPSFSPEIDSWSLIWQTNDKIWRDQFSSSFRIDEIDNILVTNDEAKLILSVNDWPMFGKNPENTRSSDSFGPDADNHSLYWYTTTKSGSEYRNPVIKNNILYIASIDGDRLYSFNATIHSGDEGSTIIPIDQADIPINTIESTPALTDDGKIIVASGTSSIEGDIYNKVFAYNTENILSGNTIWEFNYSDIDPDNPYICYSAAPTIYGDKILISSWSGKNSIWDSLWDFFNLSYGNNKLIALDFDGNLEWEYDLPAGSFSSPAAHENIVIVGCENREGNSIFALDVNNGEKLWENNIGPIGRCCPLIYDDIVVIIIKEPGVVPFTGYERVIALDFSDGIELWNFSIGDDIADNYEKIGGASISVNNGILYTVSADGTIYVLDIDDGDEIWTKKIYSKSLTSPYFLVSSPVSIEDMLYIGTPDGILYALDTTNGSIIWQEKTYQNSPIRNSPIVVDGIIYYGSENGILYSRGKFMGVEDEIVTGSIISTPINLPNPNYIWNKFYVEYSTYEGEMDFFILDKLGNILLDDISDGSNISKSNVNNHDTIRLRADFSANYSSNISGEAILIDWSVTFKQEGGLDYETIFYDNSFYSIGTPPICGIDVQNQYIGLMDSAQYRFEYENEFGAFISEWYDAEFDGIDGTFERESIIANTSEINILDNISLFLKIQFKINDAGTDQNETKSDWYDIEYDNPDLESPIFFEDTFLPEGGWISKNSPICSINVKDEGTEGNITGLNVNTASYTLRYKDQSGVHSHTEKTINDGINGTISTIKITANLTKLEFFEDITDFQQIRFYIEDVAGNNKYSNYFELKMDDEKPNSWIINIDEIPIKTNLKPVKIDAMAEDNISDIDYVELFYLKPDIDDWKKFELDRNTPFSWDFTIGNDEGGEFELCTIATDIAGNIEDFPTIGDVSFIFDPNKPKKPIFKSEYIFKNDSIPFFNDIQFNDDYKLKNVEYRLNFHDQDKWIVINNNLDTDSYTPSWNLSKDDWEYMVEDLEYYIYFRITDSLENIYETPSKQNAVKIMKNLRKNVITTPYDPDITDLESLNWNNIYNIFVNISENEISEIKLLYRYSQNNENWSDWIQYGELKNSSPFEWEFSVDNGSGFYEFKTTVLDFSGKYYESEIQSANLILFPTYLIIALVISIIFLLIVSTFIFKRLKK